MSSEPPDRQHDAAAPVPQQVTPDPVHGLGGVFGADSAVPEVDRPLEALGPDHPGTPRQQILAMQRRYEPLHELPADPYAPLLRHYQPALDQLAALAEETLDQDLAAPLEPDAASRFAAVCDRLPPPSHSLFVALAGLRGKRDTDILVTPAHLSAAALLWLYPGMPADRAAADAMLRVLRHILAAPATDPHSPEHLAQDCLEPLSRSAYLYGGGWLWLTLDELQRYGPLLQERVPPLLADPDPAVIDALRACFAGDPGATARFDALIRDDPDLHIHLEDAVFDTLPEHFDAPDATPGPDLLQHDPSFQRARVHWQEDLGLAAVGPIKRWWLPVELTAFVLIAVGIAKPLFALIRPEASASYLTLLIAAIGIVLLLASLRGRRHFREYQRQAGAVQRLGMLDIWRTLHRHGFPIPTDARRPVIDALLAPTPDSDRG